MQGSISQMLRSVPNTQTEAPVTVAKHSLDELAAQIERKESDIRKMQDAAKLKLDTAERDLKALKIQFCNAIADRVNLSKDDWEALKRHHGVQ